MKVTFLMPPALKGKAPERIFGCLVDGTLVFSNPSVKPIENIKIGERVLTHDGSYEEVVFTNTRKVNEKIVKIRVKHGNPKLITKEHPVFTYRGNKFLWVPSSDIVIGDKLAFPINREVVDVERLTINTDIFHKTKEFVKETKNISEISRRVGVSRQCVRNCLRDDKIGYKTRSKIPHEIEVTKELMLFLGYYLAEGSVSLRSKKGGEIIFSFNENEKQYQKDIIRASKNIFGLNASIKKQKSKCVTVHINSRPLAEFLIKTLGTGSKEKKFDNWILKLPLEKQKELIKGLFRGDGYSDKHSYEITTSSKILAFQIKQILLRFNILCSMSYSKTKDGREWIRVRISGKFIDVFNEIIGIKHPDSLNRKDNGIEFLENYVLIPVVQKEEVHYNGNVFNIEVNNKNSYVLDDFIVHNCNYGLFYQPNIFILYPAAMLENKGHKVVVLDCPLERISWNNLKDYLKNDNSDAYVFYTVFLAEETDKHAAKLIRETVGDVPIVFMGPEPTSRPADFTLDENTFVARGEAEYTIIDFVSNLRSKRFNKVQGLTWMNDRKIVHNPPRELIKDLDKLPFPDRRLIKKELYFNPKLQGRPSTVMLTSRNCFGRCIYCCHPDTVVDSSEGFKNICDVKGTMIRTHTGEFKNINEKFIHGYEGEMIEITARRLKIPTKLTPNHEVFIWKEGKIAKKPAGELAISDMLYFPRPSMNENDIDVIKISDFIPKRIDLVKEIKLGLSNKLGEEKIKEIFDLKRKGMPIKRIAEKLKINRNVVYTYTKWDKDNEKLSHKTKNHTNLLSKDGFIWYNMGKKRIKDKVRLTPELLRLFGYFIAEGSTSVNINRHNSLNVTFSLSKNERKYAEDIKHIMKSSFNLRASETLQDNCLHINFSNSVFGRFFENFGKEAKEKHIPDFLLNLPYEKLRYVIEGIIRGDGSEYNKNGSEIATSSRKLAYQIINIFLREGFVPEFTIKKNKESKIGDRAIKGGILYRIRISSRDLNQKRMPFFERVNNGFAVNIKSIKRLQYKGPVYNFFVDKDNSYNANFFTVSNCIPCSYMFAREIEHKRFFNCKPPVRVRSPKNIYKEFELIKKQGYKAVAIIDDNFLGLKGQEGRIIKICELIKPLKMEWGCLARADQLQNEDVIKSMADAGCVYVDIGAESFDQKVLDFVHKDLKVGDIFNAIFLLKKYGIEPKINILFGTSPYETEESIKWTVKMLKELNIEWVSFDVTIPHPNTEFYKIVKNNKWFATKSKDFEPVDVIREATVNFPNLSHDKLRELVKWAYRDYYLRPQYIWKRLSKVRRFQDFKELVQTARRLFF